MRRRKFVKIVGSAVLTWPAAARAQQKAMPVIGFLDSGAPDGREYEVAALREGLGGGGYIEGKNVAIELRWAEGRYELLPALAAELVHRPATVIAAANLPSALAAKAATATIPIVFVSGDDPVKRGLVASLNRPGGNATGVSLLATGLNEKRLSFLRELVPKAALVAILVNPSNPNTETQLSEVEASARAVGVQIHVLNASTEREIETAFAALMQQGAEALLVGADPVFIDRRVQIVALAARHAIPAIYQYREFAVVGGLISYGTNLADVYRQVGVYTGKILNGAKPADLPVQQPTKFEMLINLKTSRVLGLPVPQLLLAQADEVIE